MSRFAFQTAMTDMVARDSAISKNYMPVIVK